MPLPNESPLTLPVDRQTVISKARRVVLKLGTKILLDHYGNESKERIDKLVQDMIRLRSEGYTFSIVSSGAVGIGMRLLGVESRPTDLKKIQALAAVGQSVLMERWNGLFLPYGVHMAQILLTYDIIENRQRYLYARDCLCSVLDYGAIPVINENDSVAVDELKFGDNDTLSALTAILMDADLLILFSDIDGLYDKNPHKYPDAQRVSFVDQIDDELLSRVEDKQNDLSLGGMRSKLLAAQRSAQVGTGVIITNGFRPDLSGILNGEDIGTFFRPDKKYEKKRKRWIFFNHKIKGKIFIDRGAEEALTKNSRSLLPGGIIKTEKDFMEGAIVGIYNLDNEMIGKGITHYSSNDIERIKGQRTDQIKSTSQGRFYDEVIHRDNMIIISREDE